LPGSAGGLKPPLPNEVSIWPEGRRRSSWGAVVPFALPVPAIVMPPSPSGNTAAGVPARSSDVEAQPLPLPKDVSSAPLGVRRRPSCCDSMPPPLRKPATAMRPSGRRAAPKPCEIRRDAPS
jgi:hypothetical protein